MACNFEESLREQLTSGGQNLTERFHASEPITQLVRKRALLVDSVIKTAWNHCCNTPNDMTLVAVGGYGRSELHPHSDIDILILVEAEAFTRHREQLQSFLALSWDIGLSIGHSVRTVADCESAAQADVTIATNLMESRLLAGSETLYDAMRLVITPALIWPPAAYFEAKRREQCERHAKYGHTAYKLEPNIKEGPGGLRDIQTIIWVAERYFGTATLYGLVENGFLTDNEYQLLTEGRAFLWTVRFALHMIANRREDRLLFDYQLNLAETLGYETDDHLLGVERLMQRYYRTLMSLSRLNEMLLQLFQEVLLPDNEGGTQRLDDDFYSRNRFLEVRAQDGFRRKPHNLLRVFLLLTQHPELNGVGARTIRLIERDLYLIDDRFRADPVCHECFMAILREPRGVTHELRRMNQYGVLGRYLPAFGAIVGRMQYDLFHVYTVDEHILTVVSNLRRFALARHDHEFPLCSRIMQSLDKPEIAYLAGLFHDIAKGRGGDHSALGATDAERFCIDHGLSRYDSRLVGWLVAHHLSLSTTAQKKDINDPAIINAFAELVSDQIHLDLLYILTVADVRATNPTLWNSWKASLFGELYANTQRALRRGLERPADKEQLVEETRRRARQLLAGQLDKAHIDAVWHPLTEDYFLQHTADEIAWHTGALAKRDSHEPVTILMRTDSGRGGTAISIVYANREEPTFGRATAALDQLGLTIVDARIVPVGKHASFDTYVVLENTGDAITDPRRLDDISAILEREIGRPGVSPMAVTRRASRRVRMFTTPIEVDFSTDPHNQRTVMEITASDRPGLLSEIGRVLEEEDIHVQNAKITTVGERAEDVFFVTTNHRALDHQAQARVKAALLDGIETAKEAT